AASEGKSVRLHAEGRLDQGHARQAPHEAVKGKALRFRARVEAVQAEQAQLKEYEAQHGEVVRADPRRRHEGRAREGDTALRLEDVEGKERADEGKNGEEERGEAESDGAESEPGRHERLHGHPPGSFG